MSGRIDVHQHMIPPGYAAWLRDRGVHATGGRALPEWSPDLALEFMDRQGIATGILSISTPGVHLGDDTEARTVAREVNNYGAALAALHPGRFGIWASLPLPDIAGAVAEATRVLDQSTADGIVLLANHCGLYLGDPALDPLMAILDDRHAVLFVHPADLPGPPVPGIPPFAADFLLDTTRAAFNLVRNDVPRRYPNLRFILADAGGFVPYAAHRLAITVFAETGHDSAVILDDLSGFYFDTALVLQPFHPALSPGVRAARPHPLRQRLAICSRPGRRVLPRPHRRKRRHRPSQLPAAPSPRELTETGEVYFRSGFPAACCIPRAPVAGTAAIRPESEIGAGAGATASEQRPQQDSNLRTRLRRPSLYPLSYGGWRTAIPEGGPTGTQQGYQPEGYRGHVLDLRARTGRSR